MDNACNHITIPVRKRFIINSVDNLGFPLLSRVVSTVASCPFDVVVGLIVGFEVKTETDNSPSSAVTVTPSNDATWFSKPAATADAATLAASAKLVAPLLSENDAVNMRSKLISSMRRPRKREESEHVRSSTDASVIDTPLSSSAVVNATQVDPFTASSSSEHMTSWSSSVVVMLSVPLAVDATTLVLVDVAAVVDTDVSLFVGPGVGLIVGLTALTVGLIVGLPVEPMLELIVGLTVGLLGLIVGLPVEFIVELMVGLLLEFT
eukprot:CAMPEP_0194495374 /NCGR_PEP_ID=MMETSP0253-20130528/12998_1 /TAXON_ID=2966 /ORGANISM="Noctiluca scintillans" /LENGTH=263 /DNA_ID=CAMNT_0039336623 /DNA_START=670 /DNA_END=1458 /DNA_ORIENTATION=+